MAEPLTVHDLGELGLLQRLQPFCAPGIVGDDAAVLDLPPHRQLVVTTDVLIAGVHFSDRTTGPEDVGWRAVAANLSDLAAMGADPVGITVGLSLPPHLAVSWVDDLYRGMAACLRVYGGQILGGDLCRADAVAIAITALGTVEKGQGLYRSGAQPGQALLVTGYHGLSRAGLELLLQPEKGQGLAAADRQAWELAHQRPHPRFDAIGHLRSLLTDVSGASSGIAAMDTSDGLANAVLQICQMSNVGAQLERSQLPISPALIEWVGEAQAVDWALYGGEDFELLLCLPRDWADALLPRLGTGAAIIGTITPSLAVLLNGTEPSVGTQILNLDRGFQHF